LRDVVGDEGGDVIRLAQLAFDLHDQRLHPHASACSSPVRKHFFFEKKKQNTFAKLRASTPALPHPQQSKVFCALLFKKALLSSLFF
jgi:hypothetical protein